MDLTLHKDSSAFVTLGDDWAALAAADPSSTVFHLPQYLGIWWDEFGATRGCEGLHMLEFRDGQELAGVATLAVYPDGVTRFVGDPDVTDYLGPLSRPRDRQHVANEVVKHAIEIAADRPIELHALPVDSGWPEAFELAAKAAGRGAAISEQDACPRVSLEGGWEGYLASMSGKLRHEIRRKERRLQSAGAMVTRIASAETVDEDLETFFAFTREEIGEKADFFQHFARSAFFSALGAAFLNHALLRIVVLELDGKPIAVDVGFSYRGTWSLYNMSYDHSMPELSPGMVLVGETVRLAAEEGCLTFDFLRGREPYKYRFGAIDASVVQIVME
ncbi:MAG: GNAT family N-acetyltransferase [Actinomycetota bacterium]|nr:GNAT family N-acetyltransferase [Actinomycetota bacterium]